MLIPCQSPIWRPIQWCITGVPFVLLMFFCYCTWNTHCCDVLGPRWLFCLGSHSSVSSHLLLHPILHSSCSYLNIDAGFFSLFHFSCSEEIPCKYLQGSALQYILLKFAFPSTHAKRLTKTAVLSYCPSMSCSYLVLPCLSESICCPIS